MLQVQNGDNQAFTLLVDRHLKAIHGFVYRMVRNTSDAEDVAQETFFRVWKKAHAYQPGRVQFTTWLHRIAHNLCIDRSRKHSSGRSLELDGDWAATSPDETQLDRMKMVNIALTALPERQRTALVLCSMQGMSNSQAAEVVGVSLKALESLLSRARSTLRNAVYGARREQGT